MLALFGADGTRAVNEALTTLEGEVTLLESRIGGASLGPAPNVFTGDDRDGAEGARDAQAVGDADWLAAYDANPEHAI